MTSTAEQAPGMQAERPRPASTESSHLRGNKAGEAPTPPPRGPSQPRQAGSQRITHALRPTLLRNELLPTLKRGIRG